MVVWNGKDLIGLAILLIFAAIFILYAIFVFIGKTFKNWRKSRDERIRKRLEEKENAKD